MPKWRDGLYAVWRACERFGILPPGVRSSWDDNLLDYQALLLGYDEVRTYEESFHG